MLFGLFVLLASQLAGEIVARGLGAPIPGPVLGIVFLVAGLWLWSRLRPVPKGREPDSVGAAADTLLSYLSLVFVPAGAGVARYFDLILANGLALAVALVGSATLTLVLTVCVFRLTTRLTARTAP